MDRYNESFDEGYYPSKDEEERFDEWAGYLESDPDDLPERGAAGPFDMLDE